MDTHATRQPVPELLTALHRKFGANILALPATCVDQLELLDLHSRAIDSIRSELSDNHSGHDQQKIECANLLSEIFSDFSLAMYLFATGLIVPARMAVRRGLELGLAVTYMWDLPHEYWGWTKHDDDLSFSAMALIAPHKSDRMRDSAVTADSLSQPYRWSAHFLKNRSTSYH